MTEHEKARAEVVENIRDVRRQTFEAQASLQQSLMEATQKGIANAEALKQIEESQLQQDKTSETISKKESIVEQKPIILKQTKTEDSVFSSGRKLKAAATQDFDRSRSLKMMEQLDAFEAIE